MSTNLPAVQDRPELTSQFDVLKAKVGSIVVADKITYTDMLTAKTNLQKYVKAVGYELDPGIAKAKDLLDHLKAQKAKFVDPAEELIEKAVTDCKAYIVEEERKTAEQTKRENERLERERAFKAEQEKIELEKQAAEKRRATVAEIREKLRRKEITKREAEKLLRMAGANEEADKAAIAAAAEEKKNAPLPQVEVKADIPKVAGAPRGRNYKFEIVDAAKVPREWCKPDEVRIGEEVRRLKDSDAANAAIPGIHAFDEPRL